MSIMPESRGRAPRAVWPIIAAGCLAVAALDGFQMAMSGLLSEERRVSWPHVWFQASEWIFLGLLTPIAYYLGKRFPLRRTHVVRSLAAHAAGALLLCLAWASLGVAGRQALGIGWGVPLIAELRQWLLISLPWSFLLYFAFLGIFQAFSYYQELRERELHTAQLAFQLSDTKLRVLRAQLQPHFLFNALNAVTVLVRDSRNAVAVRMLDALSDLLRQVLRTDVPHEVPLREELRLVRQYLEIEQVRFSDRLRVEYSVEEATLGAAVPVLILQPLAENAVRHGLADRLDAALLEIGSRRAGDTLELWVRDNGRGIAEAPAEGVGLDNTRERLATMYGESARLVLEQHAEGGTIARVVLPWRLIA